MNKTIFLYVVVLLVIAGTVFFFTKSDRVELPPINSDSVTYTDGDAVVEAAFVSDAVTFSHPSVGTVTLPQAIAASGTRYANSDESLVFWEHQGEVTITHEGEVIFTGTVDVSLLGGTPNTNNGLDIDADVTDDDGLSGAWVWLRTDLLDSEPMEAPEGGQFVLTFDVTTNRASSATDCNSLSGTYVREGEILSFGSLAMTDMYCEGSLDVEYAEQLALTNSYIVEGNQLRLNLNRDYGTMVFTRQ